jgi:dephospho-CoA kinase
LTGGVGSGKSTVARLLAERGAIIIDADILAREVVEPGTPGLAAIVAAFGTDILDGDGRLDRPKLAAIVFSDNSRRAQLNEIVHPLVRRRSHEVETSAPAGSVVVHDIPLLLEADRAKEFQFIVVVQAKVETKLARLAERGMAEADARERMAAQASDEERRAIADVVLMNDGSMEELSAQVDELWPRLVEGAAAG